MPSSVSSEPMSKPTTGLVLKVPKRVKKSSGLQSTPAVPVQISTKREFRREHGISPEDLDVLQKTFPSWKFSFGTGMPHSHPIGASERAICEEIAYDEITRCFGKDVSITDIGGNANRHFTAGRQNIHSCNPLLSSSDVVRRRPDKYLAGANFCINTAQTCQYTPDVYLSVHSLYYLSRDDILNFVMRSRKKMFVAVVHRFDNVYGGFHFNGKEHESRYSISCDPKLSVHMTVNGNCVGYTHDPCLWLARNYYQSGKHAIAWDGKPIGDSWIYTFVMAPTGLNADASVTKPLMSSIKRDDHYGMVSGLLSPGDDKRYKPTLDFLKIKTGSYLSCGSFNIIYAETTVTALVPKELVKSVALEMVGRPRDSTTLRLCVDKMKSALRKVDMPVDMKISCATHGAALAFIYSLQDEIDAFNNLCRPIYKRMFSKLNSALSLENFLCCAHGVVYELDAIPADRSETVLSYNNDRTSVPSPPFDAAKAWPDGLPGFESKMALKAVKKGAVMIDKKDDDRVSYAPQFHANLITFSNHIPLVANSSKNNEEKALNNRALLATPVSLIRDWRPVIRHATELVKKLEKVDGCYDDLFQVWNARYPLDKQKKHLKALVDLKIDGLQTIDYKMKMFVKREPQLIGGPVVRDTDPRAIQGCSDKLKTAFGPFVWHASKNLCKLWNSDHHIYYTSGSTAEEVGKWRGKFESEMYCTIIELDESRYDAHQELGAHKCGREFLIGSGIGEYPLAMEVEENIFKTVGSSKFYDYSVDGTMTSGRDDTSARNTFLNGCKTSYLVEKFGFSKDDYGMMVNGDDSLVVIKVDMSEAKKEELSKFLVNENKKLGFSTKCKISDEWHDVEYCSSLFWPVKDGFVLGPKIGRRLPKLGFNLRKLRLEEIKGMLVGMHLDCSYIPVLSEYHMACSKFVKDKKIETTKVIDPERAYQLHCTVEHQSSQDTEVFFEKRYGISAKLAREVMTNCLASAPTLTTCVDYVLMDLFLRVDVSQVPAET